MTSARPLILLTAVYLIPAAFPEEVPSFRNDIEPALTKLGCNAGSCHGSQFGKGGFKLSLLGYDAEEDYAAIVKDLKGRRVNLSYPEESLILRKPSFAIPHGGGQRFKPNSHTYNLLRTWITGGVPAPRNDDPMLRSMEVTPSASNMQLNGKLQIAVRVRYSDGQQREVTHSARFDSLAEAVAEVSSDGLVTAKADGWAPIVARYMGQAKVVNILVPYATSGAPANLRPVNYIDEMVLAKWKQLGLRAAPAASDTQFLRRVYLDLIGVLPSEEEIVAFAADPSPAKRSTVIDRLLERPEYVDFWTVKWGDLLRVNRNGMGDKPMWNFHRWLRANLGKNRPVDQMVREILLARGQPNSQDVAAFYRMARSPEEAAETVSVTFMGLRLGCARCHQHPFEKWSQADYYGLAAFFARVDLKPDADYGAPTMRLKPTGFVKHPKTQLTIRPTIPGGDQYDYDADPRIRLADWLTAKKNPWFARNLVNRYWGYLMGRGLVEPLDDLRDTNPASIPELLDELARDFAQSGFDQKHILRVIANSRVYQLSSEPAPGSPPENTFYAFYTAKRLSAEQLLQAIDSATSAQEKYEGLPEGTNALQLPDTEVTSNFLDIFGRPRRLVACECSRGSEVNISQVLHLMNSEELQQKISAPSGRATALAKLVPPDQAVRNLFYATLSRAPSSEEYRQALDGVERSPDRRKALEDLLWTLLNTKEFLFNH